MRNRIGLALAAALVVGFVVAEAEARPGGRRGERRSEARANRARPANSGIAAPARPATGAQQSASPRNTAGSRPAAAQQHGNFPHQTPRLTANFTPATRPFTPAWYAAHPRAWRYTHPYANAWAAATFGTAAAWLGIAAISGDEAAAGTVYTGQSADESDPADDNQSVPQTNTAATTQPAGDFLPLGVFAVAPQNHREATAILQLAIDKRGDIRGNYYDVFTGADQQISGTLDKQTQRATLSVPGGHAQFETTLVSLTQPTGALRVRMPSGSTQQWTLARLDNPQPATAPAER